MCCTLIMIYFSPLGFITLKFLEPNVHGANENDGDDNNKSHIIVNDTIKINNINKTYIKKEFQMMMADW